MYIYHEIGKIGENLACKYITNNGYKIIERNFEARQGELDIIAKDKEELVFIEVKTRSNRHYGQPIEAIGQIKQKHMINTIKYYLYKNHIENVPIRIDAIEVYIHNNKYTISHIKQIMW